jgi:hypothetical protein
MSVKIQQCFLIPNEFGMENEQRSSRRERERYIYINNIEVTAMVAGGGAMVAVVKVAG